MLLVQMQKDAKAPQSLPVRTTQPGSEEHLELSQAKADALPLNPAERPLEKTSDVPNLNK